MMKQTKSDWFDCGNEFKLYRLEIFGVTSRTKHCIRLLYEGQELEIFHLEDINHIIYLYNLKWINCNSVIMPMTKQVLLDHSKQLHQEGLGITLPWTQRQMQIQQERIRQNRTKKAL